MMRGWKVLALILTVIVACCAVSAWAFIAYLGPIALSTGEIGPSDQIVLLWLAIGTMIAGVVLGFMLDYSPVWTDRLPMLSDAGSAASLAGASLGSFATAIAFAVSIPDAAVVALIATAIGIVFAWLASRRIRGAVREVRAHDRELARVDALHAEGTRVQADVVDVRFHNTWVGGDAPLFTVTAEYDTPSGRKRAEGRTITTPETAPIVGGTVLLWFAGDGADASNVDIWRDPDSTVDPDAADDYRAPVA